MEHLCEFCVYEKLEKARRFTEEAARDEANGHIKSSKTLLKAAREQVMAASRELGRKDNNTNTVIVDHSGQHINDNPDWIPDDRVY